MRPKLAHIGLGLLLLAFLGLTVPYVGIRLGDGLETATLLRLFGNMVLLVPLISLLATVITGAIVFLILGKLKLHLVMQLFGVILFFGSFVVLNSAVGYPVLMLSVCFSVAAFYLYLLRVYRWGAVCSGVAAALNWHLVPAMGAMAIYDLWKRRKQAGVDIAVQVGMWVIAVIALYFASNGLLPSPPVVPMVTNWPWISFEPLKSFIAGDWVLLLPFLYMLVFHRKVELLHLILGGLSIGLFIATDVAYRSYVILVPFLCISLAYFVQSIKERQGMKLMVGSLCTIALVAMGVSLLRYLAFFKVINSVGNIRTLVEAVQKYKPDYLYGTEDIVPIVSQLSGIPVLDGVADTRARSFLSGQRNVNTLTDRVFSTNTMVITYGVLVETDIEGQNYVIRSTSQQPYITHDRFLKSCHIVHEHIIESEAAFNRLFLYTCTQSKK